MRLLSNRPSRTRRLAALTLVEMMVATGIYLGLFIGAIVSVQIFALRVYTLAATKLTATEGSRRALNQMRDEYANPLYRLPMTFLEIFPVGLIVALVSAALIRNARFLPAAR